MKKLRLATDRSPRSELALSARSTWLASTARPPGGPCRRRGSAASLAEVARAGAERIIRERFGALPGGEPASGGGMAAMVGEEMQTFLAGFKGAPPKVHQVCREGMAQESS